MVAFRPLLPPGPDGLLVDREFPPPQALEPQVKLVAPLLVLAEQCPLVVAEVEQPVVEQVLVELRLELPDQEVPPPQEELVQAELRLVPEDSEVHLLAERQVQEDSLPPRSNRDSWVLRAYSLQLKLRYIPRMERIDIKSFRKINDLARDKVIHFANGLKVVLQFPQYNMAATSASMSVTTKIKITPNILLRHLTVPGRVAAVLTQAECDMLLLFLVQLKQQMPTMFADVKMWEKHVDSCFWAVLLDAERYQPDVIQQDPNNPNAPNPTYQERMATFFVLDEHELEGFRFKLSAAVKQTQTISNLWTDPNFSKSFRKHDNNDGDDSDVVCEEVGQGRTKMKTMKKATSPDGKKKFPVVCWHFLCRTPCSNKEFTNKQGVQACSKGIHPLTREELSRDDFNAIKSSKLAKGPLKKVKYLDWVDNQGNYKGGKEKTRDRSRSRTRNTGATSSTTKTMKSAKKESSSSSSGSESGDW
eukprot:g19528.t1